MSDLVLHTVDIQWLLFMGQVNSDHTKPLGDLSGRLIRRRRRGRKRRIVEVIVMMMMMMNTKTVQCYCNSNSVIEMHFLQRFSLWGIKMSTCQITEYRIQSLHDLDPKMMELLGWSYLQHFWWGKVVCPAPCLCSGDSSDSHHFCV